MKHVKVLVFMCSTQLIGQTFFVPPAAEMSQALNGLRQSSSPYVSGDTFRAVCDFIVDEKRIPFDPSKVNEGDVIFIRPHNLDFFFTTLHPLIRVHYILVTHNSDAPAPGAYAKYLDEEKLIAWFGQNSSIKYHPKFFPIPIGIANAYWPHGDTQVLDQVRSQPEQVRDIFFYLNVDNTHPDRRMVKNLFENKPFCYKSLRKPYRQFLQDLKRSQLVASPRGNGLDCHRHWEVLYMGGVPVITHSTLDPLFEGLPVILIKDWNLVTEKFLRDEYEKMKSKTFEFERMFAPYWIGKIEHVKQRAKQFYGGK